MNLPTALQALIREAFHDEYQQALAALSRAATVYAEHHIPLVLGTLPVNLQPYLHRADALVFRYAGYASDQICLDDGVGVFPPLTTIPLLHPVIGPTPPASISIVMYSPEGVALDAAIVAMEELLERVNRAAQELNQQPPARPV